MTRFVLSACVFAAATLGASSAHAQRSNAARSPWSVSLDVAPTWHTDASYQVFERTSAASPSVGLSFGRDLVSLGSWVTLGAELAWHMENTQGNVREVFDTTLFSNHLQGAAIVRFELASWVTPYARLAGGAGYLDATVQNPTGDTLTGGAWAPFGSAGAGVLLTSGRWFEGIGWSRGRVSFGVEGGYRLVASQGITVAAPTPSDERVAADRLTTQPVTLGTLDTSGAYLRFSLGLRF